MKKAKRLTELPTLKIDPQQPLAFSHNGGKKSGLAGDTLATALYAGGMRIFSKSRARARGLFGLDGATANTWMTVNGFPHLPGELIPLQAEMATTFESAPSGSLFEKGFDQVHELLSPRKRYQRLWRQHRSAAPGGEIAPGTRITGHHQRLHARADICVVGGGPAGMMAALAAAEKDLRVILLERQGWLGGHFAARLRRYDKNLPLWARAKNLADQVVNHPGIRVFTHAQLVHMADDRRIGLQFGRANDPFLTRLLDIQAPTLVAATGCAERPLIFGNNDRPGVMQAHCALGLAHFYGILPGSRAVFSVSHDLGLETALYLAELGVAVLAVADPRTDGQDPRLAEALAQKHIPLMRGWVASRADGKKGVKKLVLSTVEGRLNRDYKADLLVASAGLAPENSILGLAGASLTYEPRTGFFLPRAMPDRVHAAGGVLGISHPKAAEQSGKLAGLQAAKDFGADTKDAIENAQAALTELPGRLPAHKLVQAPEKGGRRFVSLGANLEVREVDRACETGISKAQAVKDLLSPRSLADPNLSWIVSQYHPDKAPIPQALAVSSPLRPLPVGVGAVGTKTPSKQGPLGPMVSENGIREQIEAVRYNVGIADISFLGKFRVFGPDADKLLQRVYVGDLSRLKVGGAIYTAMCDENGVLRDQGFVAPQAPGDYFFTTNPRRITDTETWLRTHCQKENWQVHIVNLSFGLGAIKLSGPRAREILYKLTNANVSDSAFPYLDHRRFYLNKILPVRALRPGFTGELTFELYMPASMMASAWEVLTEAGKEVGIRPFGKTALDILRLEKGHVVVGRETTLNTTLHDLGMGHLWARDKAQPAVGHEALVATEGQKGRAQLVGIKTEDPKQRPGDGAIIIDEEIRGYVCTVRYSPTLDAVIGLALVDPVLARVGTRIEILEPTKKPPIYARVVARPFYDPEGARLKI